MEQLFFGIDVSKDTLDLFIDPTNKILNTTNNVKGINEIVKLAVELNPVAIIFESTSVYHNNLVAALIKANHPPIVVNPRRIRDFAKAKNRLAKTDKIDAEIIALFAKEMKPEFREFKKETLKELDALVTRRDQLKNMITSETNRLEVSHKSVVKDIKKHIAILENSVNELEKEIEKFIKKDPDLNHKSDILKSVPGVGNILSAMLLSKMPELGSLNRKQCASLLGVAPFNKDSGKYRGKKSIWGGRAMIRKVLYMAVLSGTIHNKALTIFYSKLVEKGKPKKVAIVACMRKLITILNSMIKNDKMWNEAVLGIK